MAVAPLIAMKSTKCRSVEAVAKELDRRAHVYENDVDLSKSHLNEVWRVRMTDSEPVPLEDAIERRMGELNTRRAIRKDAVRAMGFMVSTNAALGDEEAKSFLHDTIDWFAERYGRENLLAAAEHYDEGTPHAQFWIAPVIHDGATGYDRLCAKELFAPDKTQENPETCKREVVAKGTMSALQEDFWREVASRYGYEHPLPKELRQKGYRSLGAYKQHEGTTRALKAEITALEAERDGILDDLAAARSELEGVRDQLADAEFDRDIARDEVKFARQEKAEIGRALDRFSRKYKEIVREIAQIAEALSVRRFLDRFRDKLVEFASSRICRDALDAGGAFESRRDGRRAEKVLEEGARKRLGELEALGGEMRAWSPFDEIGELRAASKGDAWAKSRGIHLSDMPIGDGERENRS